MPCDLCKEVLTVVEQLLKDNATEVSADMTFTDVLVQMYSCVVFP